MQWMRLLRRITLDMPVAHSSAANTAASLEPLRFGTWSRHASSLFWIKLLGEFAAIETVNLREMYDIAASAARWEAMRASMDTSGKPVALLSEPLDVQRQPLRTHSCRCLRSRPTPKYRR
jgi:hypothetical protein